ncbi:endonuclease domain-containing protein [Streptomyces halstedii]|uniref:endonuclease domain-containing protein n=1 Tax=Streptomyces halstedii TaxID=1944 RepID=UPI0036B70FC5
MTALKGPGDLDCSFSGCNKYATTRGWCPGHYTQYRQGRELRPLHIPGRPCTFDGCDKPQDTRGWCKTHYTQSQRGTELKPVQEPRTDCDFPGCNRPHLAHGLCRAHYTQRRKGHDLQPVRSVRDPRYLAELRAQGTSECKACAKILPIETFTVRRDGLPQPYCPSCASLRSQSKKFNVTVEFLIRLAEKQGESCGICRTSKGQAAWHLDHDHRCCPGNARCGSCIRGLLCHACNTRGLAWYEQLPTHLRTFQLLNDYLDNPPAQALQSTGEDL